MRAIRIGRGILRGAIGSFDGSGIGGVVGGAIVVAASFLRVRTSTGLKPKSFPVATGTAEAVPFPTLTETAPLFKAALPAKFVQPVLAKWIWRSGIALIAASLAIQLASLAFWLPRNLSDGDTGPSHVCDWAALRKHRCIRPREDAGLGIEQ